MANDYMAKLAADLEGNTMMREPEPMPIIYRDMGGDLDMGGFDFADAVTAGGANEGGADDGTYTQDQMASLVETLGPDVQGPGGEQVGTGPVGEGPTMSDEQADLLAAAYGFGSPTEGVAGAQKGFTGFGEVGLGPLTPSEEQAKQDAAKGIYQKELWPVLDAKGYEYVNKALNVPGFFTNAVNAYNEGYEGGGPGGTADFFFDDIYEDIGLSLQAAKIQQKQEEEEIAKEFEAGYKDTVPTDYFGGLLDSVGDYMGGPSKEDEIMMGQAAKAAGYNFTPMSDAEKYVGRGISYLSPAPIGLAKGLADAIAFATGTRVIGTIATPMGPLQVTEKGTVQSPDLPDAPDAGNEPTITKKRKVATEKTDDDEEDKEEEVDKPYFPRNPLPFTPSEEQTLTNIFGPDSYLLNQTGLRALV